MDWSKTKTIFIVVFLILNAFLISQYMEKKEESDLQVITNPEIEDNLKGNGIKYKTLPKQASKEQYMGAKSKVFTKEELKKLKNQQNDSFNEHKILMKLDKPYLLGEKVDRLESLNKFVRENVLNGDKYKFWKLEEESNAIVYYQTYKNKMIYNNNNAKLVLLLNSFGEITSYEQTYLEDFEPLTEEREEVKPAIKALEALFFQGYLQPNNTITEVELGYYNLIPFTASHVLTPTWHVRIDDKEDFYVNAFDGQIIQFNTTTLIPLETDERKEEILEFED